MKASTAAQAVRAPARRAVGLVRVSHVGDREGERFISPGDQRKTIERTAEREGLTVVRTFEEMDVSGGTPLDKRRGLHPALQMLESGQADVLVVAYFDRLFRHLGVQREVLDRVEAVGGTVLAVDVGEVRQDTAARWLSSTMLGLVSEYHRRVTSEAIRRSVRDAVDRGVPPFPEVPAGYARGSDGRLKINEAEAPIIAKAFAMRADGATIRSVREFMAANGIDRSYTSIAEMFRSRIVLGELHHGKLVNLAAWPAIVERSLWQRVQHVKAPRGRKTVKSERLLARLGILLCGTCDGRMSVDYQKQRGKEYVMYACVSPSKGDCPRGVSISAPLVEHAVVAKVRELLANESEQASMESGVVDAEEALSDAQRALEAAVEAFDGINAASANARLKTLQEAVDSADERLRRLRAASAPAVDLNADVDWDDLSLDGRRALIRATIERVEVAPGRGTDRIDIQPFRQ